MIFDDIACEERDRLKALFCMGCHQNVDSFGLCQTYAQVPKHLVRGNINFLVIFRQVELILKRIYRDHVNTDMTFDKFGKLCSQCWKNDYCFVVVNKTSVLKNRRFREGFDQFLINTGYFLKLSYLLYFL